MSYPFPEDNPPPPWLDIAILLVLAALLVSFFVKYSSPNVGALSQDNPIVPKVSK